MALFGDFLSLWGKRIHARFICSLICIILLSSCAHSPNFQPQVNSFVVAQRLEKAKSILISHPNAYGSNNQLLYWLDRGMVLHLLGNYAESIQAFHQAQNIFHQLYTRSVTKAGAGWVVNDY